ncbi:MAG: glycosyltransferase [Nanopusillaceae archaeon]
MKVLFILDDYSIGIPETSLIAYFKYLKMNRWTIILAIKSIKEQPCFRDLDLYIDRLYNLNFDLDDCSFKSILFLFNQINEIVLKENVNLVHIYSPFCIQCVFLSCVENNIPAILTLYDNFSFSSSFPLDYFLNNVILPSIKILTANKRIFETYKNELDIHYLPNPIDEKFWMISSEFKKENYLLLVSGLKHDRISLIDISIQKLQRFIKEKNLKLAIKVIGVESGKELLIRKYPEVEFLACNNQKEFRDLIGNATAIFGIGRIILESLYLGKVTFIINDEGNIIHVNKNNIKDIVELNFNETKLHENVSSSLFEKLIQQDGHDISKEYLNQFSATNIVSQYIEIVNNFVKDFKTYDRNIIVATQLFKNFLQLECNLHTKIAEQEALLSKVKSERDYFYNQLNTIYTSNFWKVARTYYRIRDYTPLRFIYQILRKLRRRGLIALLLNSIKKIVGKQVPYEEDFNPYDRITYLKPIAVKDFTNFNKNYHLQKIKFTAICSVYNEEESILDFLKSITLQTVKPEKFIIVDTGSTDRTVQLIREYASLHRDLNIQLIESPVRLNVAQGRNLAIKNASTDIIVSIDAGVEYSPDFFENIVYPFLIDKNIDLVFTTYISMNKNEIQQFFAKYFIPDWEKTDLTNHIPRSSAIAFRKDLWEKCGGYPEWLTYCAEDTIFAINLRRFSNIWGYVKEPLLKWDSPTTLEEALRKNYNYAMGDGEGGLLGLWGQYEKIHKRWHQVLLLFISYCLARVIPFTSLRIYNKITSAALEYARIKGLRKGNENRTTILINKRKIRGNILILSGIPFYDSGGGQRGTQLALEFIRRNWHCTFVSIYRSFETSNTKIFFDIDYTLLELYRLRDFDVKKYIKKWKDYSGNFVVLIEFPHPLFIRIVESIKKDIKNSKIVYDCIDNWDSSLGWKWYSIDVEKRIINNADLIITSANSLRERLNKFTDKQIHWIPQGINTSIFNINTKYPYPPDLPQKRPLLLYTGALWGEWFDWDLLRKIAESYPEGSVICIGDYKQESTFSLPNVYFLGLKPQSMLPHYLQHVDCCIIPFKINDITQHTNPLKIYEYLSMGKPVVTTPLADIDALPYTFISHNHEEFLQNIKFALATEVDQNLIKSFVEENSWSRRVEQLLSILGMDE